MKNLFKRFFTKPIVVEPINKHTHIWKLQYRTGNPEDGKSEVCRCECGQWAVRHYGKAEYHLLNKEI